MAGYFPVEDLDDELAKMREYVTTQKFETPLNYF